MQLTTFQVLDKAIEILLFGFPLFVLFDFIRVLPKIMRASLQPIEIQTVLPDPWDLAVEEPLPDKHSKAAKVIPLPKEMEPKVIRQAQTTERLTFQKVCTKFADKGFSLNKFPSSRYRYRVADLPNCRFKKLEQAIDWLNEQPEPIEHCKYKQLEILNTVII